MRNNILSILLISTFLSICTFLQAQNSIEKLKEDAESDANAQYQYALCLLQGKGVKKDTLEASEYLLASARGCLIDNFGYDENDAKFYAEQKLKELVQKPTSYRWVFLTQLGRLCCSRFDLANAANYYKQAIELGSASSMAYLGILYFYVDINTSGWKCWGDVESYMFNDKEIEKVRTFLKSTNRELNDNAGFWLKQAVNCGCGSIPFGIMGYRVYDFLWYTYSMGIGVDINMNDAIKSIEIQSQEDDEIGYGEMHVEAYYNTDKIVEESKKNGEIIDKNRCITTLEGYRSCFNIYKNYYDWTKASWAGFGLGRCYYEGKGVHKDYKMAVKYLLEVAKESDYTTEGGFYRGYGGAMELLSKCYRFGRGVPQNEPLAEKWHQKAVKENNDDAKKLEELRKGLKK